MVRGKNKFGARKTALDGMVFDSKAESIRWAHLCLWQRVGLIANLRRQVPFQAVINGHHCFTYVADHVYRVTDGDREIVEDVKGVRTKDYIIKKKVIEALFPGIRIREISPDHLGDLPPCLGDRP